MNIIQTNRLARIEKIKGIISKVIDQKRKLKYKEFIVMICNMMNVSKRTAREYIDLAFFQLKLSKKEICRLKLEH